MPKRTRSLPSQTTRMRTAHGSVYVTVVYSDSKPQEVFIAQGKAGSCESAQNEAIARLIALSLRHGASLDEIAKQLDGITCCPHYDGDVQNMSTPDAIARALTMSSPIRESEDE